MSRCCRCENFVTNDAGGAGIETSAWHFEQASRAGRRLSAARVLADART